MAIKPIPTASPNSAPPSTVLMPSTSIGTATAMQVSAAVKKLITNGIGVGSMSSSVLPSASIQAWPNSGPYQRPPSTKAAAVAISIASQLSAIGTSASIVG